MPDPIGPADNDAPAPRDYRVPGAMDRRSFLTWTAEATLGASAVLMAATVARALVPPERSIDGTARIGRLAVAKVAELKVGKPLIADYGSDVLFVVKTAPDTIAVFDSACPHVGCKLRYNEATRRFECPCHGGVFDISGRKLAGPATRDMVRAKFEIAGGEVVVSGFQS
jgi:nitrite reductase/ring-hydroxylating ferredoxin subunit